MKGVILHGGHGTRLRPLTHTGPKQLLPIANKPMSQYCLESLRDGGMNEIAVIIGGNGHQKVVDYYEDGEKFGVRITYILQDEPRGIAQAVGLCKEFVGDDRFTVFLGDNILKKGIGGYAAKFEGSGEDAHLLLCRVDNPSRFGIADLDGDGNITKIMEKPKDPPTDLAVTGIYFLTPKIFDIIDRTSPSARGELEITDALHNLLKSGGRIGYDTVDDYWKDTGTPGDIIHANRAILEDMQGTDPSGGASPPGKAVIMGEGTRVDPGARITGPVIIGDDCVIGAGATVGPNVSVGDGTVLERCTIRDSIIMSGCKVDNVGVSDSIMSACSSVIGGESEERVFLLGEGTKITL